MKQVTIAVDEETFALAETRATERNISVAALLSELLQELAKDSIAPTRPTSDGDRALALRRCETELRAMVDGLSGRDNLPREQLYWEKH